MQYDRVLIYTKKGNLLDYLHTDKVIRSYPNMSDRAKEYYAQEREIQLIARVRWETNGQYERESCLCSIKCPVNPLPIKGEFELPCLDALRAFLKANGWTLKQDMCAGWFK